MILTEIKDFLVHFVEVVGYPGVFIAMVLESCLIPIPSEITMPVAGALAATGAMNVHAASFTGAIANVVGSLMAYWLGVKIPEEKILGFLRRWGKYLLVPEEEYLKTKKWLNKYGVSVSFFSRLLPGIRTVVSLPAGVARISLPKFIGWTFLGSLIWCYVLVYAGFVLGENWESIEVYFHKFQLVIIAAGVLFIGWYVWKQLSHKPAGK
jgi:membrane protein DedA with SNARE-associated domain